MAPIYSSQNVPLRTDRSITQFMLENVCHTDPEKVICEDTLTKKQTTYGGLREEAFRVAQALRSNHGLCENDTVSIISRSCVSLPCRTFPDISNSLNATSGRRLNFRWTG